jgi:hypothetical protein
MKRTFFIASAASAISVAWALLAEAGYLTKRANIGTAVEASGSPKPSWHCARAVVWLDSASGIYYHKGDGGYGRTQRGAYTCEKAALDAGHRARQDAPRIAAALSPWPSVSILPYL